MKIPRQRALYASVTVNGVNSNNSHKINDIAE